MFNVTFAVQHPEVNEICKREPKIKRFQRLSQSGRIQESWNKDENGNWEDTTEHDRAVQAAQLELEAAQREARKAARQAFEAKFKDEPEEDENE